MAHRTKLADGTEPVDEIEDAFAEWDENAVAQGTGTRPRDSRPLTSRAATLHDPMTTGILAEASRAAQTVELSPAQIEAVHRAAAEIPEGLAASPRLIRRPTRNPPR